MDGAQPEQYKNDVLLSDIIAAVVNEYGYTEEMALNSTEKKKRDALRRQRKPQE